MPIPGLQTLVDRCFHLFSKLKLTVNIKKSQYVLFKTKKSKDNFIVSIDNGQLERVNIFKYLGVVLNENLGDIGPDVVRCYTAFLAQFNGMFSKFGFANAEMISFLFKTYCSSFYGAEMWLNDSQYDRKTQKMEVCYHRAVKRICGFSLWDSNHQACEQSNIPIFKHLLAKRVFGFYRRNVSSKSPCMKFLKFYFFSDSYFGKNVRFLFNSKYGINVDLYDFKTLHSRIKFVERHEERSGGFLSDLS